MTAKPKGFSLIEVSMVLAISVVMMGVVAGVYSQRRNIASDDAAQQIASIVQTVQNEAKQGQGPASGADNIINSGETLWGNAIRFSNSCAPSGKPCFIVNKLVKTATTPTTPATIKSYEEYQIATPENFEFLLTFPTSNPVVVFRNSTGQPFVFSDPNPFGTDTITDAENPAKYVTLGSLSIVTARAPLSSSNTIRYNLKVSPYDISIKRQ
jgi:prepilin-type N-terminal cleavage/methylation domain-containing protein